MDPKHIKHGVRIELLDSETDQWLPLTIISIVFDKVECRTLANEPILTTTAALIKDARLRPYDGSCADCGYDAHDGPCVERVCSECGAEVSSRCSQHPYVPVNVYRRKRYLAEVVADKPYPTREQCEALRRDIAEQMRVLRNATEVRQGKLMITTVERCDVLSALENAAKLIESLPSAKRTRS